MKYTETYCAEASRPFRALTSASSLTCTEFMKIDRNDPDTDSLATGHVWNKDCDHLSTYTAEYFKTTFASLFGEL